MILLNEHTKNMNVQVCKLVFCKSFRLVFRLSLYLLTVDIKIKVQHFMGQLMP